MPALCSLISPVPYKLHIAEQTSTNYRRYGIRNIRTKNKIFFFQNFYSIFNLYFFTFHLVIDYLKLDFFFLQQARFDMMNTYSINIVLKQRLVKGKAKQKKKKKKMQ